MTERMKSHAVHHCELKDVCHSDLPKLSPQAGFLQKLGRKIQLSLIVSPENYNTKLFFRSTAAIKAEIQRHLRISKTYIIHPLSKFYVKFEVMMAVVWCITLIRNPLLTAFLTDNIVEFKGKWYILNVVVNFGNVINIIVCFLTGIPNFQTKEIILEPRSIAKRYLLTFFVCDLFSAMPVYFFIESLYEKNKTILFVLIFMQMVSFARLNTAIRYCHTLINRIGLGHTSWKIIELVLRTCYMAHWGACYIYTICKITYEVKDAEIKTWLELAEIEPHRHNVTVLEKYLHCLLIGLCHFFGAGSGQYDIYHEGEAVLFAFIMMFGFFYKIYVAAMVLQLFITTTASNLKYREVLNQLDTYANKNKLLPSIRKRMFLFYEHRFEKHYFKEQAILNTLSQHLKYEMYLHSCRTLLEKVTLFNTLSRASVGLLMSYMEKEVFLPNEVIRNGELKNDYVYFIAYGSVAIMLQSGIEYKHLEDGDWFGLVDIFVTTNSELDVVVSLEFTEVFKLHRNGLERCIAFDKEIYDLFKKTAMERYKDVQDLLEADKVNDSSPTNEVVNELRKGKILEHSLYSRKLPNNQ